MYTLELVWLRSWFLLFLCFWFGYLCLLSLSLLFPFFSLYIWISRFSLSLHFIALMLLFVYFATKRGRHGDGETWLINCWIGLICFNSIIGHMQGVHLDCNHFYFFSLLLYLDYMAIFFSHTPLYPGNCVSVCANYKYWNSLLDLDASFNSQHVFGWLDLDGCDWELCKLCLKVLGVLCNSVLTQNCQRGRLLGQWVLILCLLAILFLFILT